jgi:hypothetical protein
MVALLQFGLDPTEVFSDIQSANHLPLGTPSLIEGAVKQIPVERNAGVRVFVDDRS